MQRIARHDRIQIRIDAASKVVHPNGWVDYGGTATRVGVLDYPEFGTRELRPVDEVMAPESLASLFGVPVTIQHPSTLVDSTNARSFTHGWVLDVKPNGPLVEVRMRVATDDALAAIDSGIVELSCGYEADYDPTPGEFEGESYTGVQRNIRYNHLALVDTARAGHVARLRLDSAGKARMRKLKIKSITRDLPAFIADSIAAEAARLAPTIRADAGLDPVEIMIDGETLVLPRAQVDAILAMLGGGASAAPPAPSEPPPTDGVSQDPSQDPIKTTDTRVDAATVEAIVRRVLDERDRQTSERSELVDSVSRLMGPAYTFDAASPWQSVVDAVVRADVAPEQHVRDLGAKAAKGDQYARGALRALLDVAARPSVGPKLAEIITDRAGASDSDEHEDPREAMMRRADAKWSKPAKAAKGAA